MREQHRVGVHYLEAVTALLQRVRRAHPTAGLYEAADLQWSWRTPRSTDTVPQLFWFDHLGRPEAAVIATDWGDGVALDPIVMPNATPEWIAHVVERQRREYEQEAMDACLIRKPILPSTGAQATKKVYRILYDVEFILYTIQK
jgi:hypothetical protein